MNTLKNAKLPIQSRTTTKYRIHVEGKMNEVGPGEYIHTYEVDRRPASREEAYRIAEDFSNIDKLIVEEISTTVNTRLLPLK